MLVLGSALNMSGCSILSGSSGANSRGSSIEVSFSSPQGPAAATLPHSAAGGGVGLAAVAEAVACGVNSVKPQPQHGAGSSGSLISAFSSAAGAAAAPGDDRVAAGCLDVSREASSCMSEGCEAPADGAVHGGELGATALEGQMHGGKRSSSLVSLHNGVRACCFMRHCTDQEATA
jgi:hypothetical protein